MKLLCYLCIIFKTFSLMDGINVDAFLVELRIRSRNLIASCIIRDIDYEMHFFLKMHHSRSIFIYALYTLYPQNNMYERCTTPLATSSAAAARARLHNACAEKAADVTTSTRSPTCARAAAACTNPLLTIPAQCRRAFSQRAPLHADINTT